MAVLTIHSTDLINIADQLTDAQIEIHALYLMANSLQHTDCDAFQRLANTTDETIERAKKAIDALRGKEGSDNA